MHSIFEPRALRAQCDRRGIPGRLVRRLFGSVFKLGYSPWSPIPGLSETDRRRFTDLLTPPPIVLVERNDSGVDGATKLVFATQSGGLFESVVLRLPSGRTTLCLSSQIGCVLGCTFCATGRMSERSDLTKDEILCQVLLLADLLRQEERRVDNVVFMGMGEPLLNETAVFAAIEGLTSGGLFNLADDRVLVSTVGLPEPMLRLHRRFPAVNVALSLHSSRDDVRAAIMPVAKKVRLATLRSALDQLAMTRRRGVMIEYLGFDGVNDSDRDMDDLANYLDGLPCHLNLIPYNEMARLPGAAGLRASSESRLDAMAERLRGRGFTVTRRNSLGRDIDAACGQLIRRRSLPVGRAPQLPPARRTP